MELSTLKAKGSSFGKIGAELDLPTLKTRGASLSEISDSLALVRFTVEQRPVLFLVPGDDVATLQLLRELISSLK